MNGTADRLTAPALLTYVFMPAEGPRAKSAAAQTAACWWDVTQALGLLDRIPRLGVPAEVRSPVEMPPGGTGLLAAASRRGPGVVQAVLRAEHDLL